MKTPEKKIELDETEARKPSEQEQQQFLQQIQPKLTVMKENFNLLVIGKKGYGKTSWIRGFLANKQRVLFVDSMQYEYTEDDGLILHTYDELVRWFIEHRNDERQVFRIVCRFSREDIMKLLVLWSKLERTTLVVEEIDMYNEDEIALLVEHGDRGRHNENNLIGITRHPVEVDAQMRKHVDCIVSFQQDDVNTLSYLEKINKDEAKRLPALHKGEVVVLTGFEYLKAYYERDDEAKQNDTNRS